MARPIAGTTVHAISLKRLGIRTGAGSVDPVIGARTADTMSAIWATAQQVAAIQKRAVLVVGDTP